MKIEIKPIKTKADYKNALSRIDELFDSEPNTPDGDTLDILVTLVEAYEQKHYQVLPPDPIEAILFRMEQLGLKQSDMAESFGGTNRASEVLNRKRELTVKMMRALNKNYKIPPASLLS